MNLTTFLTPKLPLYPKQTEINQKSYSCILLQPLQLWEEPQSLVSLLWGPQTHLCLDCIDSADHVCHVSGFTMYLSLAHSGWLSSMEEIPSLGVVLCALRYVTPKKELIHGSAARRNRSPGLVLQFINNS